MVLGVFDSGLGGLTVLREIIKNCSYDKVIYYGDTARLPYGDKDQDTLIRYAREDMDFLIEKGADEIVMACGTICSNTLDEVKDEYPIRIIGIIGVLCKEALRKTVNKKIGVIATPATIRTKIFTKKMEGADVYEIACKKFTPLIEKGMMDSDEMDEAIAEYISPLKEAHIDTQILGCTHYPLLMDKISEYLGYPVNFINSGVILAEEFNNGETKKPELEFYVSGDEEFFKEKAKTFLDIPEIEKVRKI